MHQLDMVLLDEIDKVKDMPETAQDTALVESKLEDGTKGWLGQRIRHIKDVVTTPGQFVADRGGINLGARHFELGECHQYVHCVVTR